jgi:hypothetical protein
MEQFIVDTDTLSLPQRFAEKINSEKVCIREVSEGLLLSPVKKESKTLRGVLKGTGFSTQRYFEQKRDDKELEG